MEPAPARGFTDIVPTHWLLRALPPALRPYGRLARWDRPIGTWLLLFPCWWSATLAAAPLVSGPSADAANWAWTMALCAAGAFAMRGAGCTWNDLLDRHIDAQVERTRGRPLPAGEVTPRQAMVWMAAQGAVGAAVLFSMNPTAILVGLASLAVVAVYPLMKRVTSWPQLVLGVAFNWGALVGWAAMAGGLAAPAFALHLGGIAWTMVYDTIYAMQDQRDDAIVGVRSTARRFAAAPRRWLAGFALATTLGFGAAGAWVGLGALFWIGLAAVAAHLGWQIATLKPQDPADCLRKFRANRFVGWILLVAILLGPAV